MNAMPNVTADDLIRELHSEVKRLSSVPKVAESIGMDYYALRKNLIGESDMKLSTMYAVLGVIDVTWEDLMRLARLRQEQSAG